MIQLFSFLTGVLLLMASMLFAVNTEKTTSDYFLVSCNNNADGNVIVYRQSPIVAIGVSLGKQAANQNPRFIEELKAKFGNAYRGFDKSKNRHVLVLSSDDASPAPLKLKVQQLYPQSKLSEISSEEFEKITLTN